MTTFDEKPKAVGTSITVTVNSTTMDCSTQLIIQKKKKKRTIALRRTLSSKYAFFTFLSTWHNFVRLVWIEGRPRGLPKVVASLQVQNQLQISGWSSDYIDFLTGNWKLSFFCYASYSTKEIHKNQGKIVKLRFSTILKRSFIERLARNFIDNKKWPYGKFMPPPPPL